MPSVEELLSQVEPYAETGEAHEQEIYCIIHPDSRTIEVPEQYQLLGVVGDKKVERLWFQCPKVVGDNKDISDGYVLFINYRNANGDPDAYRIKDMEIEGENITFSWELEENVTAYQGTVDFSFRAIKPETDSENKWNTTMNSDCNVLVGLQANEQITKSEPDALAQIWDAIDELKLSGGGGTGSGVTTDHANTLWAIIQKTAFAEQLTDEELTAFKTAWGIEAVVVPATGVRLNKTTLSFTDSSSQTLIATVEPSNSTDSVTWETSDAGIATVSSGVVSPVSNGSCTITAKAGSYSASCKVTVNVSGEIVTLQSISATYAGGEVTVGTALTNLTGITVTAHYSDGSTDTVTGYTLRGEILEGKNTITVSYGGKTTTFTVTGIAESGGIVNLFDKGTMVVTGAYVAANGMILTSKNSKYAKIPVSVGTYALQKGSGWAIGTTGHPSLIDTNGNVLCSFVNLNTTGLGGSPSDPSIGTIAKANGNNGIAVTVLSEKVTHIIFSICVNGGTDDTDTTMMETGDTCHDYVAYV